MLRAPVLAYLSDPFGLERSEFFIMKSDGNAGIVERGNLIEVDETVVTIEASRLIADLRNLGVSPPANIIDLVEALRLWRGKSRNDGGVKACDPWRILRKNAGRQEAEAINTFRQLFEAQSEWPENQDERLRLFEIVARALQAAWQEVCGGLKESKEIERFEMVESPVAQVFYGRQKNGVRLDLHKINELVTKADREKYTAYNQIAETLGVSPSGLNFRNVGPYLTETDAAHLAPYSDAPNFEEYLRLAATYSTFAEQLVTLVRSTRDLRALARLRGEIEGIAHPEFQIMGTVTGRILVSNPHLQQLRKQYRDIILAADGKKLAYLDFAQFEPGILASLSQDQLFIKRYNGGDIYNELAVALFNDAEKRDLAKRMFLSFTYGMSADRIVGLLGAEEAEKRLNVFEEFISSFPGLLDFRQNCENTLEKQGYVDTLMGNRRYRTGSGKLKHDERRWAVSQAVQGTASLVFKEAVLGVAQNVGPDVILLPMHDAVLVQLSEEQYETQTLAIQETMLAALKRRCPEIIGRVVISDHF